MTRIVFVLAFLAALGGCKKQSSTSSSSRGGIAAALAKMGEFAHSMCQCTDKACADAVQERMTKWATDAANNDEWSKQKPDEATMKKMTEVGQKYAECMTTAMAPPPEPPPPPPAPEKPPNPAAVPAPATVDALFASARTWARGEHDQLRIVSLDLYYVGADGVVDPNFGKVSIELGGASQIADDPKRRTGAPVVPAASQPTTCMEVSWTAKGWTKSTLGACRDASAAFPRCPVTAVWKRAIDNGAPADALAVLRLREGAKRKWSFSISDEPRKIEINHSFDDDCELAVEKP